jgi:type IX secretion system PorP/SprF family membrane protein
MKKIYLISCMLLLIVVIPQHLKAQDQRSAQSFSNPLRINPAIMGINTDLKFVLNYRSQWASIDKGYTTSSFTGMYPLFFNEGKSKLDIGISAIGDRAGAFKTIDGALAIDYNQEIAPNNILCLSLIGGYVQRSLDISKQTFDQQYVMGSYTAANPTNESTLSRNESHPDVGFGFMWFLNPSRTTSKLNAYAGISGFHLNKPNESLLQGDAPLPMRFAYQGGVKIFGSDNVDLSPNFRLNIQNGNVEMATGLYVDYSFNDNAKFVIGAWYRTHDAIAVLIGFEHKNFTLGYSYDMVNSGLSRVATQVNAHEITLSFKISRLMKSTSVSYPADDRSVRCSPISSF